MSNSPYIPFITLQQAVLTLGFDWQNEEYFFCHGEFPMIESKITGTQDYFGILLCTEGDIDINIDDIEYNITSSTLLIARPSSIVHIIRQKSQYKGILLFVGRDFLLKNIVNADLTKPFRELQAHNYVLTKLTAEKEKTLIDVYKLIYQKKDIQQSHLQLEIIRSLYLVFVCEVADFFLKSKNVETRSTRNDEITEAFRLLLADPINITHTTAYFAYQLNISPKHLIKAVKTITGKAPGVFINEKITENAKLLLANPSLTITDISEQLGFSETASFSKFFKKQTGQTPTRHRNNK